MNLLTASGELLHASSVDDVNLSAETPCASCGVHGNVAAADNSRSERMLNGSFAVILICFHQVHSRQELVGGINALEVFAVDAHEFGKACARTDENGFKAVIVNQLVD